MLHQSTSVVKGYHSYECVGSLRAGAISYVKFVGILHREVVRLEEQQ